MIGKTLGTYEIPSPLGKGGMGEVWRARDSKLGREVAIKTLPEEFARDEERLARFEREAKLLASLNHPNIATIHGLEEDKGTRFLVLELVEGDTLADRLKRGAIPVEESLKLALQIAEALEAAHEKGVIHRDLKPANIKVTPDGKVKVLDFGLAKAFAGDGSDVNLSQSPTLSMKATQQGVILGTAAYMSPEQASGETTDKRADIWSFGVVLFEMVTGRQTFDGKTVSHVLADVLRADPDWNNLPPHLHPRIKFLLERCLEKESKDRYGDISDARVDIQQVLADPDGVLVQPVAEVVQAAPQSKLPWVAAFALGLALAGIAVWNLKPDAPDPVVRFSQHLPEGQQFTNPGRPLVAVSPDGSRIVYVANERLYMKAMDTLEANPIPGTNENPTAPFFSPDGQWIGYWSAADGQLKKIAVSGGAPIMLSDAENPRGAPSWEEDDTIVFSQSEGIKRISASGGEAELLVAGTNLTNPQMLPDGQTLLFDVADEIAVQPLNSDERTLLLPGEYPRYVSTGHIVYGIEDVLFAVPFDVRSLELRGGSVSLVEDLQNNRHYAVSDSGVLVYVSGTNFFTEPSALVWVDREGREETLEFEPRLFRGGVAISPDGSRLVAPVGPLGSRDLWIFGLGRGSETRLTFETGAEIAPMFTTDGESVAFVSDADGVFQGGIFLTPADGAGEPELLASSAAGGLQPQSFTPDNASLIFKEDGAANAQENLGVLDLATGEMNLFLDGQFRERSATLSPDGQWLAYQSDQTGEFEVYVRPFPDVGANRQTVSVGGGWWPLWSRDGQELFYVGGQGMMRVSVESGARLEFGRPELVFSMDAYVAVPLTEPRMYAISPTDQRFLVIRPDGQTEGTQPQINVILNWFEELKERVPVP